MSRSIPRSLSLLGALLTICVAQGAEPPVPEAPVDQVTVNARKWDDRTLEQVIVPHFVRSHGAPTAAVEQIPRWRQRVCPDIKGLKPDFGNQLKQRILATAQRIGAQTFAPGQKCPVNIEIVFTPTPQALVDHIQHHYSYLLGSARKSGDTRFVRPIQSWYVTGTRSVYGFQAPVVGGASQPPPETGGAGGAPNLVPDAPWTNAGAPAGEAGSHLGSQLRSELLHVLIIADAQQLSGVSLDALTDYISLIALTRMTKLDTCNELPSIIDLLAPACSDRARPASLTVADTAFLQALYASTLVSKLGIEEGELRDRMVAILNKKP